MTFDEIERRATICKAVRNWKKMEFRTVKQIMEYYLPERKPLTGRELGEEIARRRLAEFRDAFKKQDC